MNCYVEVDRAYAPAARASALVPVFALSLFTSAALLFWVQPLVARMLLPLLGGAPAVWNTCMVFFQALLLAGYAYALLVSQKLSLRNQAIVHALLLIAGGLVLPFALSSSMLSALPTQTSPIGWLLSTLLVTVGPPFFLLSATAPLLQRWFSHSDHKAARDPYFLYAVSNAGSLLSLLAFPFLLEPLLTIRTQSVVWAVGYAGLVASIIACALFLKGKEIPVAWSASNLPTKPLEVSQRLWWTLLAFIPSSLMLGVTTYIATDVASVPLIWIVPLILYLLTFVLAFANKQLIPLRFASFLLPLAIVVLGSLMILRPPISAWIAIILHLSVFFLVAFVCHRRLAITRPPVSKLPEYYLWIAGGGVLGGAFNALLAPVIFSTPIEYPIAIVLGCLVRPATSQEQGKSWWRIAYPSLIFLLVFGLSFVVPRIDLPAKLESGLVLLLPLVLCYALSRRRPIAFALGFCALMFGAVPYMNATIKTLVTERNFFGVWRVTSTAGQEFRTISHGNTVHGVQFNDESRKCEATSYYHKDGPLGQIFDVHNGNPAAKPVAAVGLGAGTIGTYSLRGSQWDFYDIDPTIVRLASDRRYFTFLSDCTAADYRVVLGDARLRLRDAASEQYGLIVIDAFSADSVPAHLLTTAAFDLYLSKLSEDGVLAFHISNHFLNFEPLLSGLSRKAGLAAYIRKDSERNVIGRYPSVWVALSRNDKGLGIIATDTRWRRLEGDVVWTDDFSNILSLLK